MDELLITREFTAALRDRYRLQDWWSQVRHVRMPFLVAFFRKGEGEVVGIGGVVGSLKKLGVWDLVRWDASILRSPAPLERELKSIYLGKLGALEGELKRILGVNWRKKRKLNSLRVYLKERLWDQEKYLIFGGFHPER